jgi:two-component system phosphate regulon sensor histidine kinase PhoR
VQFRKARFSIADLLYECKDVMSSKALENNIQIRVESPEGMPLLDADRDKIKQVLLNLLSNAIKYNRPNGTVMLRAEVVEEKEIALHIQDTGLGIPDESLPHLFEKFFRVREHESRVAGTGLGLSICKQIINGHGGRIEVKSKIGVGTVFSVFLPYSAKSHPPEDAVDESKK